MAKCHICKEDVNLFDAGFDKKGRPIHMHHMLKKEGSSFSHIGGY